MTALLSVPKRCVEDKYVQNNRPLPEARSLCSPECTPGEQPVHGWCDWILLTLSIELPHSIHSPRTASLFFHLQVIN